jgi:hypothetical protein
MDEFVHIRTIIGHCFLYGGDATKKEWAHALFAPAFITYQISWIYRVYFLLD